MLHSGQHHAPNSKQLPLARQCASARTTHVAVLWPKQRCVQANLSLPFKAQLASSSITLVPVLQTAVGTSLHAQGRPLPCTDRLHSSDSESTACRVQLGDSLEEYLIDSTSDSNLRQLMMSMSEAIRTIAFKVRISASSYVYLAKPHGEHSATVMTL